ncbi:uncharacterized protein LOC143862662 isoform X1 [Tasmannia lanceolata]|uniref:uncharacterized protein LOC143862662 isoform X1 n=1 Tax=Tasmannia lanceolata TaxID=3420 RepID=UPI00406465D1
MNKRGKEKDRSNERNCCKPSIADEVRKARTQLASGVRSWNQFSKSKMNRSPRRWGLPTWRSPTILFDVTMRLQPYEMHTCLAIEFIVSISVKCYMVQLGECKGLFSKSKLETNNFVSSSFAISSANGGLDRISYKVQ